MYNDNDELSDDAETKDLENLNAVLADIQFKSERISRSSVATSLSSSSSFLQNESTIETALALNKLTDEKLYRLEKQLVQRLHECRRHLGEVQNKNVKKLTTQETFRYVYCGIPYFKDKNMFLPPDNEDTILMNKSEMYNFSLLPLACNWTIREKKELVDLIFNLSKSLQKDKLESKLAAIKRRTCKESIKKREIAAVKHEIDKILKGKVTLEEVVLPVDEDYDWDLVSVAQNSKHNAQEYKAFWKLWLHPKINKANWSNKEALTLKELVKKYNSQDWECVAKDLNTSRSALQCFMKFRSPSFSSEYTNKWTREEEEYLRRVIDFYKSDNYIPWNKIAAIMPNHTRTQIYTKYLRLYSKRTGRFLPEEDVVILTCVNLFGKDFHAVKQYIPGRSVIQLRIRYNVLLNRADAITWTIEEDKKLMKLLEKEKQQKSGYNYSRIVSHFPGKNRVHLRSRYITLKTFLRRNPHLDISMAPRRVSRELYHDRADIKDLGKAIERLRVRLEQEVENKRSESMSADTSEIEIESEIIEILTKIRENRAPDNETTHENTREARVYERLHDSSNPAPKVNVQNVKAALILLYAKLNKTKFQKSELSKTFTGLCEIKNTVRSYSRKKPVSTATSNIIWGQPLGHHYNVLPPNYDNLMACSKLFEYAGWQTHKKVLYVGNFVSSNLEVREQYTLLLQRMKVLFTWPLKLYKFKPDTILKL